MIITAPGVASIQPDGSDSRLVLHIIELLDGGFVYASAPEDDPMDWDQMTVDCCRFEDEQQASDAILASYAIGWDLQWHL